MLDLKAQGGGPLHMLLQNLHLPPYLLELALAMMLALSAICSCYSYSQSRGTRERVPLQCQTGQEDCVGTGERSPLLTFPTPTKHKMTTLMPQDEPQQHKTYSQSSPTTSRAPQTLATTREGLRLQTSSENLGAHNLTSW